MVTSTDKHLTSVFRLDKRVQVSASLLAALMPEGRGELSSRQLEGDTPVQWEQVTSHCYRLAGYPVQGGAVHRDFSQVSAPHLALYSLPHLGAGAAARMLAGRTPAGMIPAKGAA